ncbi:MAG TPA: TolC family protein [Tepidisphaeraceae bacterium]|nr:TolC family protein [Tepidisphaeraceae bacterium]
MRYTKYCILLAVLSGCSPDHYRRDADAQVGRLLKDRTEKSLGYTPETKVEAAPTSQPSRAAYSKLPATPLTPAGVPPLEPITRGLTAGGKLGPELLFDPEQVLLNTEDLGADTAISLANDRFRLGPSVDLMAADQAFGLFDSLQYAIQHSRNYRARTEDLYLAALSVTLQRHLFTPRPFAQSTVNYDGGQLDADYRSAFNVTQSAGVRQQLPYGGEVVAEGLVRFVQAINDNSESGEDASLALRASIPLLRGAGMVNLEPLINSERRLVYQVRTFEEFRRSFVVDIASAYFSIVNAQSRINNNLIRYTNAVNLVLRLEDLYAAGRQNFLQVQQARQQRLDAQNQLITSQQDYQNQLDDFKILLGMPVETRLDVVGVALLVPVPDLQNVDYIALAEKHRLLLQTARDQVDDAQRGIAVARNGLLPDLDLSASGRITNRDNEPAARIDSRTATYSAGATLDWPLDRLRERNDYRAALIDFERAQRNLISTRDNIAADVRTAARAVESALFTLDIQRRSIDLAQRRVEYSNELLIQGKAQARDVTDSQNALLNAQNSFDRAKADLQIQILRLLRDTGTLRVDPTAGTLGTIMKGPIFSTETTISDETWVPGDEARNILTPTG